MRCVSEIFKIIKCLCIIILNYKMEKFEKIENFLVKFWCSLGGRY